MRVLIIEDDPGLAEAMKRFLAKESVVGDVVVDCEDGIEIARRYDYDVITLDLMLLDVDGFEVLRRLRASGVTTPVVVVSGLDAVDHKLRAFGFGADDYVTKPFDRRELVARLRAVVRRARGHAAPTLRVGKLQLDMTAQTVTTIDGASVDLTRREQALFELLALRRGTVLTKEMILDHLYGGMDEPDPRIIDVFICTLRRKLARATGGERYIENVWGRGYVLREPTVSLAAVA